LGRRGIDGKTVSNGYMKHGCDGFLNLVINLLVQYEMKLLTTSVIVRFLCKLCDIKGTWQTMDDWQHKPGIE
jgi:hypothetical protein